MNSGSHFNFRFGFLSIFFLFFSILITPQKSTVISMPDNGVFVLDSRDTVLPYGVNFISMNENNLYDWKFLNNMKSWLTDYYVNRSYSLVIIDTISKGKYHAKMFRDHLVSSSDAIELVVSYGYAKIDTSLYDAYVKNLFGLQSKAMKDKSGMWRSSSLAINSTPDASPSHDYHWSQPGNTILKINLPLLSVSLLSFGLAYDYFVQVSDLGDLIDDLERIGYNNTGELKSMKTRKTFVGVFGIVAGLVTLSYSFENVEVNSSYNQVNFKFKF